MITAEERETIRRQAMERIRRVVSQVKGLGLIKAKHNGQEWDVDVRLHAREYFYVAARGTRFDVYITATSSGYLISIPNHYRCGHVPSGCSAYDVMNYIGIENQIDAATLAAGINFIIKSGLVPNHPGIRGE